MGDLRKIMIEPQEKVSCPYLDTINRAALDFDFQKCCSISLSLVNVYTCLVCGKYLQGRGKNTHAYIHCLEVGHHMFMRLEDGSVWCLPETYKVDDRSLDDIKAFLNPTFSKEDVACLDKSIHWSRALDGSEYMPGLIGLNNMKANDYVNVVLQILARVRPIRDFFLSSAQYHDISLPLVQRTSELLKKIWHPKQFKGQVSPHEFMQTVMAKSTRRFLIENQGDPLFFLRWLINELHSELTHGKPKGQSIITESFQGEAEVWTEGTKYSISSYRSKVEWVPFLMLGLELPQTPLFKDAFERMQIPQVPLFQLLNKYNGHNVHEDVRIGRRRYQITQLPRFLILSIQRFMKNNFFWEKNPSIINFPVKNLDLKHAISVPRNESCTKYDLIASVSHEGKVDKGNYKVYIHRWVEDLWYEVQDLTVVEVLPQMVALSAPYIQVYERRET